MRRLWWPNKVRLVLDVVLLGLIYYETGPFTMLGVGLLALRAELAAWDG